MSQAKHLPHVVSQKDLFWATNNSRRDAEKTSCENPTTYSQGKLLHHPQCCNVIFLTGKVLLQTKKMNAMLSCRNPKKFELCLTCLEVRLRCRCWFPKPFYWVNWEIIGVCFQLTAHHLTNFLQLSRQLSLVSSSWKYCPYMSLCEHGRPPDSSYRYHRYLSKSLKQSRSTARKVS